MKLRSALLVIVLLIGQFALSQAVDPRPNPRPPYHSGESPHRPSPPPTNPTLHRYRSEPPPHFVHAIKELKVVGLNVWAVPIPGVSAKIGARLELIPEAVSKTGADIVVIEEAWKDSYKKTLIKGFEKYGYIYSQYGEPDSLQKNICKAVGSSAMGLVPCARGLLGNGLLIVSKYSLGSFKAMAFRDYTRADEYAAGKGAIYVDVYLPGIGYIDLFATHLGAFTTETIPEKGYMYSQDGKTPRSKEMDKICETMGPENLLSNPALTGACKRVPGDKDLSDHMNPEHMAAKWKQAEELVQFIQQNDEHSELLLVGDLNTHYYPFYNGAYDTTKLSDVYNLMTCADKHSTELNCLKLKDSFVAIHGLYGSDQTNVRPYTYDKEKNNYAGDIFAAEPPDTIDYIFSRSDLFKPVSSQLILTERLDEKDKTAPSFLSDHFGIETTFEIHSENYSDDALARLIGHLLAPKNL